MTLHVYNTLTRRKEEFVPIVPGRVKFYVCGVTVYDHSHLGHGRSYVTWDTIRRYLTWRGYQVTYIQNFTDIDDKILRRAEKEHSTMTQVAETYIASYLEDMSKLNILPADAYPRATQSIPEITALIAELEAGGFAYPSAGDIYYHVRRFTGYGKLSGKHLDQLRVDADKRLEDAELKRKKDPVDFALWKASRPGEPFWNSAWGPGRPGWHIECSAMVRAQLGDTIDIHAGGEDLQFPHHENEIAQSEAATGKPLARYWLHNGFLNVKKTSGEVEKMSKSLGNFWTLKDLLEKFMPMAFRLYVLQAHYRTQLTFSVEALENAQKGWSNLEQSLQLSGLVQALDQALEGELLAPSVEVFRAAMDDDFNTPEALVVIFALNNTLMSERNVVEHGGALRISPEQFAQTWRTLRHLCEVLGLEASERELQTISPLATSSGNVLGAAALQTPPHLPVDQLRALIEQREQARQAKNYTEADRIRGLLKDQGIVLIDHKDQPTTWLIEDQN